MKLFDNFFVMALVALPSVLFSQSITVRCTIKVVQVYSTYSLKDEDERYRFNFWLNDEHVPGTCLSKDGNPETWHEVNFVLKSNFQIDLDENISLSLQGWEDDDCKDNCSYNDTDMGCDDGGLCNGGAGQIQSKNYGGGLISGNKFVLFKLPPGNDQNNIIEIWYCGGLYRVRYLVTYLPPSPDPVTVSIKGKLYSSDNSCDASLITLKTANGLNQKFNDKISYVWEYHIDGEKINQYNPNPEYCGDSPACTGEAPAAVPKGKVNDGVHILVEIEPPGENPPCCYEPPYLVTQVPYWRNAGTTTKLDSGDSYTLDHRSLAGLKDILVTKKVTFRVRIKTPGGAVSANVISGTINVDPLPPVITKIETEASCPNGNTGIIYLNDIIGVGEYQYNLRPGFDNSSPCNPEIQNSCFSGIITGEVSDNDFTISNAPAGKYTLWLSNTAPNAGNCSNLTNIAVDTIGVLALSVKSVQHVTCNGMANGKITLEKSGGKEPFIFTVADTLKNSSGNFVNLSPESYITSVIDGCNQVSELTVKTINITQPIKLSQAAFSLTDATCLSPGNGSMAVGVSKSTDVHDVAVSSIYQYRIFQGAMLYQTYETTVPNWSTENLPVNNYQLVVTEKGGLACNGYVQDFAIAPPPALTATNIKVTQVTCHAGNDGNISFTGNGGSGEFLFKLAKFPGDTLQNTEGDFSDITSGDYTLIIENNLPGCDDRVVHPDLIKVIQPDSIAAALNVKDISCFGVQDGIIEAAVTGGTPAYTFTWEKQVGSVWITTNQHQSSIANQDVGKYRLKVIDSKNCADYSYHVLIREPDVLHATTVVKDIVCFGESGNLITTGTGGVQPYLYAYSLDGTTYSPLTPVTPISEGAYFIRTSDKNGCVFNDSNPHVITAPTAPLDFTYTLSDYNGYNISCYGGNNGFVSVLATGGNGASYNGYQFAVNAGTYQDENLLNQLLAGDHLIQVRDARGCVASKTVSLNQTANQLNLVLHNKQDVVCYGDETGSITVTGVGGLQPYSYTVNESLSQESNQFVGLGVGTYQLQIVDKNNCKAYLATSIVNLNPRIQMQASITDVRCFGGTDGAIAVTVTDGVSPFEFSWMNSTNTNALMENLSTGSYNVTITDQAGCKRDSSFVVNQPSAPLTATYAIVPVCYGKTNGSITVHTNGGTHPYQYSFSNPLSFQTNEIFTGVVGMYPVTIKDYNGCTVSSTVEIPQRNDRPEPNFLVASRQNALDTLVIKEISLPKPDSLFWIFDPQAVVISNDSWSPQIKFANEGTYFVSMTGYFSGCEYSITKNLNLKPYDPDAIPDKNPGYSPIESVVVSPNPSNGSFAVEVRMIKKYNVSVIVYDVLGSRRYEKNWMGVQMVEDAIVLDNPAPGVYLLRVITDTDARDIRLIVNQ